MLNTYIFIKIKYKSYIITFNLELLILAFIKTSKVVKTINKIIERESQINKSTLLKISKTSRNLLTKMSALNHVSQ